MTDPFKEASRYQTAARRLEKWRSDYVSVINVKHAEKLRALRATLSPAAARLVTTVEQAETEPAPAASFDAVEAEYKEPQLSPRLLEPVPELPPGGIIETTPKARAR